jgi:hypothetical protein
MKKLIVFIILLFTPNLSSGYEGFGGGCAYFETDHFNRNFDPTTCVAMTVSRVTANYSDALTVRQAVKNSEYKLLDKMEKKGRVVRLEDDKKIIITDSHIYKPILRVRLFDTEKVFFINCKDVNCDFIKINKESENGDEKRNF